MNLMWKEPADQWIEGIPVGNGRLGAMYCAGKNQDVLYLNEDTLWSGYPSEQETGFTKEQWNRTAELTRERKYGEAMAYMDEILKSAEDDQMYLPLGNLVLDFGDDRKEVSKFTRCLNLQEATAETRYSIHGKQYTHTCFCSAPANGLVYRIKSEEPFTVRIHAEKGMLTGLNYDKTGFRLHGQCPGRNGYTKSGVREGFPHRSEIDCEKGIYFDGIGKLETVGGTVLADADGITCTEISGLTLCVMVRTSFHGFLKHPYLEGKDPLVELAADEVRMAVDYETLLKEHITEYRTYFDRVSLELGEAEEIGRHTDVDLKQRILGVEQGGTDPELYALTFHFGRYLLISSSRPETQAANLQGIWNDELYAPWFADYTVNINTEMNYWMTGPCNLSELEEPLFQLNEDLLVTGTRAANELLGCDGSVCFHNTDLWRKASPAFGKSQWSLWPFGAAWMCRNLYDTYLFGQDRGYLKKLYPVLKENVRACRALLTLQEDTGTYAVTPATSPENEFLWNGRPASIAQTTENTMAIIRNLFRDFLEASETLQISDAFVEEIKIIAPKLTGMQIGSDGRILEWNEEFPETDRNHRHMSHLYEVYPGRGISPEQSELYQAAQKSLEERGDAGTGWSLAWKVLLYARMKDGSHAGKILSNFLSLVEPGGEYDFHKGGVYSNLLCAHPPFQIDGNLGVTAGISEMLLQSHEACISLLPAIPEDWTCGQVNGLRARGTILTKIAWNGDWVNYALCNLGTNEITVPVYVKNKFKELAVLKPGDWYQPE